MAETLEENLERLNELNNRPKPTRVLPPKLSELESSPRFLGMSDKEQAKVYDRWRVRVMDVLEDPNEKARIDLVMRAKVQQKLASRGLFSEAGQATKRELLSTKANFTRGINGAVAQAARIAASEVATQFPGTNEKETQIAVTNQGIIRSTDKRIDELIDEYNNRGGSTEIIKTIRALGETKRKAEAALKPIIDKTKTESWIGEFAGNQQLAADEAKASLDRLRKRFRQSDKFVEDHPLVNAVASGAGQIPGMIAQALTKAGTVSLALDLGQRAEDQAREVDPKLTEGEAFAVRLLGGTASVVLERIGIDAALGKIFKGSSGLTGAQISTRARSLTQGVKGGVAEAVTEPAQSIAVGEIIQAVTGEEVDTLFTPEAFKERLTDALAGGILGTGTGLGAGLVPPKKANGDTETETPEATTRDPLQQPKMARGTEAPPLTPEEAANPRGVEVVEATSDEALRPLVAGETSISSRDKKAHEAIIAGAPAGSSIIQFVDSKGVTTTRITPGKASPPAPTGSAPTSEPTASEAPPLTPEQPEGPVGLVQRADQQDVLVQFQSDRDKSLFDAYRRFTKGESTPEDTALIKDATEQGVDVQAFGRDVQAATNAADPNTIIPAPAPPSLSQELQEASRAAEQDVPRGTFEPTTQEAPVEPAPIPVTEEPAPEQAIEPPVTEPAIDPVQALRNLNDRAREMTAEEVNKAADDILTPLNRTQLQAVARELGFDPNKSKKDLVSILKRTPLSIVGDRARTSFFDTTEEPVGPPKAPREVFRQVRQAVTGVPNVRTRITGRKTGSGVTWTKEGEVTFLVTPSDIQGKGDDPRFVMDEEVTHLAEVLGARDEWDAGGNEGTFTEFLDKRAREHVARIDEELLDLRSADRQVAARSLVESIRAYSRAGTDQKVDFDQLEKAAQTGSIADVLAAARTSGVIRSDGSIFSEWLRQIDQLERTGTTTELAKEGDPGVFSRLTNLVDAIRDALRKSLEWIDRGRSVLRNSPTFTGDIEAITRKRQELSLPALTRPQTTQTTQQAPPVAEVPRTPPEVVRRPETGLAEQGTEGMPVEEAARVHRVSDPPPTPPLRATPEPGEGGFVTGPQNKNVDMEREALGLEPRDSIMRTTFGKMWDRAKEVNFDGQAGSQLVNELLENPRALNPEEVAILGHEQVRRRHELDKAMAKTNDGSASEYQRGLSFEKFRETQVAMNRLADAIQNMGTLQGQALNLRKMLLDDQFDLVTLKRSTQAGVNGGDPLTEKQERQIEGFYNRVQQLRTALANARNQRAREQIEFDLAKAITDQVARDNREIFKRLSVGGKALAASTEVMNLARAMMTTFDFSATLRQGGLVTVSHPILASKAFEAQMKAFASERGEFEVMQGIRSDPLYAVMVADGNILHIGETTLKVELDSRQRARDEAYQSVISQRIPVVKGFGRAYQTFMNQLRFDYYKLLVDNLGGGTPEQRNAIAKFVNITTGRGGPRDMGDVAGFFGAIFFAPRYVASRFQYLMTLPNIMSQPKGVRLLIAKEVGRQLAGIGGVIGLFLLAKEAFDEEDEWGIEWDARSSDFAKLRIGNTRVDVLSGLQQIIVLGKRVWEGEVKESSGEIEDKNPVFTVGKFLRTKLSPVAGTFGNVLSGEDVIGRPAGLLDMQDIPIITNLTGARGPAPFVNLFVPLAFREVVDAMEEQGVVKGTALSLATLLGWSASTYQPGEDFGESAGGSGKLLDEYGYGGLIKEFYTRSSDEAKLLLKAFSEDKPAVLARP